MGPIVVKPTDPKTSGAPYARLRALLVSLRDLKAEADSLKSEMRRIAEPIIWGNCKALGKYEPTAKLPNGLECTLNRRHTSHELAEVGAHAVAAIAGALAVSDEVASAELTAAIEVEGSLRLTDEIVEHPAFGKLREAFPDMDIRTVGKVARGYADRAAYDSRASRVLAALADAGLWTRHSSVIAVSQRGD